MSEYLEVEHPRVGKIRVPSNEVLHLEPLPGFPKARQFVLMSDAEGSPFAWLACIDDPELSFRVADPRSFFPDYDPFSNHKLLSTFADVAAEDLVLLAIVNFSEETPRLNLAAPLVVDAKARSGRQIILDDEAYAIGEPFTAPPFLKGPAQSPGAAPVAPATDEPNQIESNPQR